MKPESLRPARSCRTCLCLIALGVVCGPGCGSGGSSSSSGKALVGVWGPVAGTSDQAPELQLFVTLTAGLGNVSIPTQAATALAKHLALWDLTTGQAVTTSLGVGTPDGDRGWTMLKLSPAAPLLKEHEYGVRLAPHPEYEVYGVENGELTHFYVGSRLRVREIILKSGGGGGSGKARPAQTTVALEFTEAVSSLSLAGALTLTNLGTGQSIAPALYPGGTTVRSTGVVLHTLPLWDPSQRLRLTLASSVATPGGQPLDGLYQLPGGTPARFDLTFEPSELDVVTPGQSGAVIYRCGYGRNWWVGGKATLPQPSCANPLISPP